MREHYRDMSYGTFDVQGGVFGWFPVPQNGVFYYSDDNGLGTDRDYRRGRRLHPPHAASRPTPPSTSAPTTTTAPTTCPTRATTTAIVDLVMFVHPNEGGECGGTDIWSHSFRYSGWAAAQRPVVRDQRHRRQRPAAQGRRLRDHAGALLHRRRASRSACSATSSATPSGCPISTTAPPTTRPAR